MNENVVLFYEKDGKLAWGLAKAVDSRVGEAIIVYAPEKHAGTYLVRGEYDQGLGTETVARMHGVTPYTVSKWIKAGRLPGVQASLPGQRSHQWLVPASAATSYRRRPPGRPRKNR